MNIVILDGFFLNPADDGWSAIKKLGNVTIYNRTAINLVVERSFDADIILTNKTPLNAQILRQLPRLKFISILATGFDIIDIDAARQQDILVANVPAYSTDSVAQYVFAALLAFIQKPEKHHDAVKSGQWSSQNNFSFWLSPLYELSGKTMGIIGMGNTGRAVAKIADTFGMKVIAVSPRQKNKPDLRYFSWQTVNDVFEQSDIVSLHCPLNEQTLKFVNKELLLQMKPSSLLINSARGELICEEDLADVLNNNKIAGAILDVLSVEPPPADNPLLSAKNCQITPHIAWATIEARKRLIRQTYDNIDAFLKGNPVNIIN